MQLWHERAARLLAAGSDGASRNPPRDGEGCHEHQRGQEGPNEPGSSLRLAVKLGDVVPVDEAVDEGLEVVRPAVAIVDVVGMLPDVDAEDRRRAMHQRTLAVG